MKTLIPILRANISREASIMTDGAGLLQTSCRSALPTHESVDHKAANTCACTDRNVHTNTIEGFFSIFKRGMKGVYQHCGQATFASLPGRVRFPL